MRNLLRSASAAVLALFLMLASAPPATAGVATTSLDGKWQLTFWPQPVAGAVNDPAAIPAAKAKTIAATVPGNVEIDLQAAGLIPDPMIGNNLYKAHDYEGYQWCYTRTFTAPALSADQKLQITFHGLDCFATVWLNGKKVGAADNMFIEHSFDITPFIIKGGVNKLQVVIRSAVLEAQDYFIQAISTRGDQFVNIRKAGSQYGWDIMPRMVSAGLWRDVTLEVLDPVRIEDVNWITLATNPRKNTADVYVFTQFRLPPSMFAKVTCEVTLSLNGKIVHQESSLPDHINVLDNAQSSNTDRRQFTIDNAQLWWPRGYGDHPLYEATVALKDPSGKVLDSNTQHIGLRTVRLDNSEITTPDNPGKFQFFINGEPIFIRGSNWVPLDALHSRDRFHVDQAVALAVEANCNMLRCWGGNVYEDHRFFDLCDSCGIMVWQDFAIACTMPPNSPEFQQAMYEEARSVVIKLRNHCSLALWSGGNETDNTIFWMDQLHNFRLDPSRELITRKVLPEVLYQYDHTRPYLPSSPYLSPKVFAASGGNYDKMKDLEPEQHLWGPRGYYKAPFYTANNAIFVSEIGYHGCPNRSSLEKMFTPGAVYPWTEGNFRWNSEWQTKAVYNNFLLKSMVGGRNSLMINQIKDLFGECPTDLDQFIYASQCVQAEAMKYFVEMWRAAKFDRTGIIWWNLRGGWPIISDDVVDYYFSKKRAFYYIANVQRDVCVVVNDAVGGALPVVAVNDTRQEVKNVSVEVSDVASGKTLFSGSCDIPVNGKTVAARIPEPSGQGMLLVKYTVAGKQYLNHYLYGKPPFKLDDYRKWIQQTGIYDK